VIRGSPLVSRARQGFQRTSIPQRVSDFPRPAAQRGERGIPEKLPDSAHKPAASVNALPTAVPPIQWTGRAELVNRNQHMTKALKRYDAEFKRDAVELLLKSGKPLKRLAHELGVCDVTLRDWRDRHLAKMEPIEQDGHKVSPQQMAQELRRLHKELQIANRRNEILKKALGILSEDPLQKDLPS
jgi:transposase